MNIAFQADKLQIKIFYFLSMSLIAVDQATKHFAQKAFQNQPPMIFLNDFFRFDYAENPGAFLGMGTTLSDPFRFWIFTIFVFFLMAGLAVYLHLKTLPRSEAWAYTLVFAGGIGNLIDRTFRPEGRVIDFMNMGIGPLRTGVFNIADMAILLGLIILLFGSRQRKTES